jgi:hypothetical protein
MLLNNFKSKYFIIFGIDGFENLRVKIEEQKQDPRIIKVIKT